MRYVMNFYGTVPIMEGRGVLSLFFSSFSDQKKTMTFICFYVETFYYVKFIFELIPNSVDKK